ncbi:hypothetical protein P872_20215 [Rhodonellum psychrophilum GCM71 = DSM 17998]|uniref:Uncharacterized protein n=2 Tax=Rhodonellum TaxID=336827 RepID=U5BTG6_9BACT|nr:MULTISPECIES: DUF5908 family protein [Rhodonellum]ERM81213.1 hypothetical protein P872_20215 [Rhodonellum psychrophilum GCM71 = DSM 17998]MDO9554659.1 DUF5908 family protein [Rhodonellum sp.]SDZ52365.1 hypothetical protein SAMN05444412_12019 [Rhodonellum ikkaensis]
MTLIIKELVIKGEVMDRNFPFSESQVDEKVLMEYLAQMKKEIEQDCFEKLLEKLENRSRR